MVPDGSFRNFRVDRMREIEPLDERFVDEPGKTMRDFLESVRGKSS